MGLSHTTFRNQNAQTNKFIERNLRAAFSAVGAADEVDMAPSVLVATAIPPLERL